MLELLQIILRLSAVEIKCVFWHVLLVIGDWCVCVFMCELVLNVLGPVAAVFSWLFCLLIHLVFVCFFVVLLLF